MLILSPLYHCHPVMKVHSLMGNFVLIFFVAEAELVSMNEVIALILVVLFLLFNFIQLNFNFSRCDLIFI